MKRHIVVSVSVFFLLLCCGDKLVLASGPSVLERGEIIAKEMDCVQRHLDVNKPMGWADVCYTDTGNEYSIETDDALEQKISDDMDLAEKKRSKYVLADELDEPPRSWYSIHPALTRDNPLTHFEMGSESFAYSYREPDLMKAKGYMYGVFGSFTYRLSENEHIKSLKDIFSGKNMINMFRVDGRYAWGKTDYQSNGTGQESGIPYWSMEFRGIAGLDIPVVTDLRVTPFLGFGYRYLYDDSGGGITTTGHWGYDRESQYVYLPTGIETEFKWGNNWSLCLTAEYDFFIDGEQTSHLEDGGTGYDTLKNDQDKGRGMRGSFRVMKESKAIDFFFEPFVRYWDIENSDVTALTINGQVIPVPGSPGYVYGGREPKNNTTEYGVKCGIRY